MGPELGCGLFGLIGVVTSARERDVAAGGQAEAGFEVPRHVALVGKACGIGGVGKRGAASDLGRKAQAAAEPTTPAARRRKRA